MDEKKKVTLVKEYLSNEETLTFYGVAFKKVDENKYEGEAVLEDVQSLVDAKLLKVKPDDGVKNLTVDQLKAVLTEKGVEIPDGAKKADLQALLDAELAKQ